MTSTEIINKLKEMRMSTMADALQHQLEDPDRYKDTDFGKIDQLPFDLGHRKRPLDTLL